MIVGIGIDVVEMARIKKIVLENPEFVKRVLTENEYQAFITKSEKRKIEYFAGRFACKEAFSKAYGTGIGKIDFKDVEVLSKTNGRPYVSASPVNSVVHVSISHTDTVAVAEIIIEEKVD